MRALLQPAFVLHHRDYRETSLLLDLFTEEYGRVTLVARGVRTNRSKLRALLQPFTPLLISWQGKSELMGLLAVEPNGLPYRLTGDCLLSGFYLNELLIRLLQKHDPHPQLYTIYQDTLIELQSTVLQQKTLRLFEKKLIVELGYGLQLKEDAFRVDQFYRFYPEWGFKLCENHENKLDSMIFSGKSLQALALDQLDEEDVLRDAKRLMRLLLAPHLGGRPLQSRKLFIEVSA